MRREAFHKRNREAKVNPFAGPGDGDARSAALAQGDIQANTIAGQVDSGHPFGHGGHGR